MTVGAGEAGPFLSLEQAMLPRTCEPSRRTLAFSIYNFVGYGALALGAGLASLASTPSPDHLRPFFLGYLLSGLLGAFLYSRLSRRVESERRQRNARFCLRRAGRSSTGSRRSSQSIRSAADSSGGTSSPSTLRTASD